MRQPSTGVHGVSDVAMLSSLLNISDSVPPIHARSATTCHFLRDLGDQEQRASFVFQYLRAKNKASQLSWGQPGPSLHPYHSKGSHFLEASLWILRRSCRETQPSSVFSTGRCNCLTSHSPSSVSRYLGAVSPPSSPCECCLCAKSWARSVHMPPYSISTTTRGPAYSLQALLQRVSDLLG